MVDLFLTETTFSKDFDWIEKIPTKSHYNFRVLFHKAPTKNDVLAINAALVIFQVNNLHANQRHVKQRN